MYPEIIGKYIAKKRKEGKITQKEFAEKLGVTDKTVSRWENGHYMPDITFLQDIATILDVTISELLNGQDGKKDNVDDSITKIVEVSKQNINIIKRNLTIKGVVMILVIIIIVSFLSVYCVKKIKDKLKNENPVFNITSLNRGTTIESSIGFVEKEDGWVCHFTFEHEKNKDENYYSYGCDNYKYDKLEAFQMTTDADDKYLVKYNHPTTLMIEDYQKESKTISDYFINHKITTKISLDDLDDLKLSMYTKEDVVETFNKAIESDTVDGTGNYIHFPENNYLLKSDEIDNMQFYVGYYLNQGHIAYVNIDLKIKDEYLSDKIINNTASKEEKKLFNYIKETEYYIIETQVFWHKGHYEKEEKNKRLLDLVFYKLNNPEQMSKEELVWMERFPEIEN